MHQPTTATAIAQAMGISVSTAGQHLRALRVQGRVWPTNRNRWSKWVTHEFDRPPVKERVIRVKSEPFAHANSIFDVGRRLA